MKVLQHGRMWEGNDVLAVNKLITLKQKHQGNYWPVVEACVDIWAAKKPQQYKSFLFELEDMKQTRRDKFASSKSGMFRYTLDVPEMVIYMLRKLYTLEEMPMDKQFFRSWARKFPRMQIAERI